MKPDFHGQDDPLLRAIAEYWDEIRELAASPREIVTALNLIPGDAQGNSPTTPWRSPAGS
jgi:hypothetical protein